MRFLTILLLVLSLYAESNEEDLFLRRIAEFWEEGEHHLAKSQIEEFLISFPESPFSDALTNAMGDLSLREKNYAEALDFYSKIKSPELIAESFLNKMQCLFELQWYVTLGEECEAFLQTSSDHNVTYFLATSLYAQMLNATKNPELLESLAHKAKPYFETLLQTYLAEDIEEGYAHVCYILKDYENAIKIYHTIASKNKDKEEEMLFQIALIEAESDKEKAIDTFSHIMQLNQKKVKDAAYNRLVLSFDLKKYEEISDATLLDNIPETKLETATLLIGKSLIHTNKFEEAISLLKKESSFESLTYLIDAAYLANDLVTLDGAIELLTSQYAETKELPKAYFSRALILKKMDRLEEAKEALNTLLSKFPDNEQKTQVLFELTHLDFKAKNWASCYQKGAEFLQTIHDQDLTPFVWHYFLTASSEMGKENKSWTSQLISDLETYLSIYEEPQWQIMLAKTYYDLGNFEKAILTIQELDEPNAHLILAFCHKESNPELFIEKATLALEENADLLSKGAIHSALFNAYLDRQEMPLAAEHLYSAFQENEPIREENLLWLADFYLPQTENNYILINRVATVLEKCTNRSSKTTCDLAKMVSLLGRVHESIAILEKLEEKTPEAKLLLAESLMKTGNNEKATALLNEVVSESPNLRSKVSAQAAFALAKMAPSLEKKATQLKNIVIQKTFDAEPIYLEAALTYVELQGESKALLQKIKHDFEKTDDLLSKDYHAARRKNPDLDNLYQNYMKLIEAKILVSEKNFIEAKNLLQQIIQDQSGAALLERAHMLLTKLDEQTKI